VPPCQALSSRAIDQKVTVLGPAAAGIEHRGAGFVNKQTWRAKQDLAQAPPQRHQLGRGIADPGETVTPRPRLLTHSNISGITTAELARLSGGKRML
jgi:hypothetical protein